MSRSNYILPAIVFSQFACTSLWFAGNAIMPELTEYFHLPVSALGHLTSAVQLGFISGTLIFAIFTIADRFSPSRVFLISALFGAIFNLGIMVEGNTLISLIGLRYLTGFFLAGIYPVGMKIAADYFDKGLGKSLGYLVGALVLGTAFPHLLRGLMSGFPWRSVVISTSILALLGGLVIGLGVPDGPFRKRGSKFDPSALVRVFANKDFRSAAFGYFGHMWELYAFWAFVPVMLATYGNPSDLPTWGIPILSFLVIGLGGPACVTGGYLSQRLGVKSVAFAALFASGLCCLVSPLVFTTGSELVLIGFLLFWGMVVIADSPLFSTLVATNAQPDIKGTALTIVNSIGFAITIASIQLLTWMTSLTDSPAIYLVLAIGPVFGLIALRK